MFIVIFAPSQYPAEQVAAALRREEIEVVCVAYDAASRPGNVPSADAVFLIAQERDVISTGEKTSALRARFPSPTPLFLCTPQSDNADRKTLFGCGAAGLFTPGGWTPGQVTERILAELYARNPKLSARRGRLVGASRKMLELYRDLQTIAPYNEPVLVLGETGTGKELVAAELYRLSGRTDPYLAINCPELTPELFGSELFGHEKGAFTGAVQSRKGLIASVGQGVVFLDEIGELDLSGQAKLLRVIEDRTVRPIGANRAEQVQARLIFATNRNLEQACNEGKFRQDLFERMRGLVIELPPLRERRADLILLFQSFVEEFNQEYNKQFQIPSSGLDCLFRYDWPGNVRELRAVVRRSATFADASGVVSATVLEASVQGRQSLRPSNTIPFDPAHDRWRDVQVRAQKQYFRALLTEARGVRDAAIKASGLSRSQFYEKLKEIESE
jgi:two-component system, NtrC family, response regulator HydG